ncbi:MAG: hypothetical protein LBT89_03290 [Planctomycetaceae bacterium]|jgi:hypothetical protein|nr:hypothetical protein [Planctomycetaceae bacterium]
MKKILFLYLIFWANILLAQESIQQNITLLEKRGKFMSNIVNGEDMANFHHLFWTGKESNIRNQGFAMLFAPFINDSLSMYSLTGNGLDGYLIKKTCEIKMYENGNIFGFWEVGYAKDGEIGCLFHKNNLLESLEYRNCIADKICFVICDINGKVQSVEKEKMLEDIDIPNLPVLSDNQNNDILTLKIPTLKKQNEYIQNLFGRIQKIHSFCKRNDFVNYQEYPLLRDSKAGLIFLKIIYLQKVRRSLTLYTSSASLRMQKPKPIDYSDDMGYNMDFTKDGKLECYYEGFLDHQMYNTDKNGKIFEKFSSDEQSIIEKEVKEYSYCVEKFVPCGNGIEVKFHSTGYPASYKTIVKNRLFGRQIEWNEKGEVISDIDIDIPKPWADAPQKPAEPVAMRKWTSSSSGKYHIQAEYVSADENQVMLKNEEGEVFPVALSKLSTEDQNYVKEQLEAKQDVRRR